ncbi:MAG: Outer membrane lipoprotein Omp16 precursor [Alphaproteobacteria bacterium ADurb.Bin438]|nr:MAG: Outer membrane lipoprotein Omp16 precursor [Alphaproteobacteria bacterium ADurb.Bin438]
MKLRLLSLFAAIALLTACAGTEDTAITSSERQYPVEQAGSVEFKDYTKDRVFFAYDKSSLSEEAIKTLRLQVEWLKANPEVNVQIQGHCDERGTREYNLGLGERRANVVKEYLVSRGVAASRVRTISYGKEKPAVFGANEAAWAQNRRSETVIAE